MRCYFKCKVAKSYRAIGASGKAYTFTTDKLTEVSDGLDIVHFRRNDMLIEHTNEGRIVSPSQKNKPLSVTKFRSRKLAQQPQPEIRPVKRIEALLGANPEKSKDINKEVEKPKRGRGRPRKNSPAKKD